VISNQIKLIAAKTPRDQVLILAAALASGGLSHRTVGIARPRPPLLG
jgi:hypothetical protein